MELYDNFFLCNFFFPSSEYFSSTYNVHNGISPVLDLFYSLPSQAINSVSIPDKGSHWLFIFPSGCGGELLHVCCEV